jgi:hypothetical protein
MVKPSFLKPLKARGAALFSRMRVQHRPQSRAVAVAKSS